MAFNSVHTISNSFKINVPRGRIFASSIWQKTQLISSINREINVQFCDDLGEYDFLVSDEMAVIFLNEADLVSDTSACKRRLVRFCRNGPSLGKVVLAQRTLLTREIYREFQKFCGIEIGLTIIPVNTMEEAAKLLKQLIHCEMKKQSNPFRAKPNEINSTDEAVIKSLQSVPGFGDKKALLALEKFSTLENIANASQDDLAKVVGIAAANSAYNFFNAHY